MCYSNSDREGYNSDHGNCGSRSKYEKNYCMSCRGYEGRHGSYEKCCYKSCLCNRRGCKRSKCEFERCCNQH